jgi:hypothetical protein
LISDTQFFQRYKKLAESKKQEKSHKSASELIANNEKFFEKRISYFEKIVNSNANYRYKINKLGNHSNYLLEKYSILQEYSLEKIPGFKPKSSWPVNLNDLISHLFNLDLFQMFHQPFDLKEDFYQQAFEFIEKYYNYYLDSLIKLENEEFKEDKKTQECEMLLYEEYLIKSVATVFTIKLMQGNFTQLFNFLKNLKKLFSKTEKTKKFECLNLATLNNKLLIRSLNDKFDQRNKNLPKFYLKNIIEYVKENKILPIMRNYSIFDITSIPKNILFTPVRNIFSNCSSITTDSSYLYIILSGVNGGMIKIGTGYNKTIKGKVYLHIKFTDSNLFALNNPNTINNNINNNNINHNASNQNAINPRNSIASATLPQQTNASEASNSNANLSTNQNSNHFILNEDVSYQWVYLKGKIYLKQNANSNHLGSSAFSAFSGAHALNRELGYITILDPGTFKNEGRIKMVLPEEAKHPAIKRKNENFVLLSDGENLNVLLLEPVLKAAVAVKEKSGLKNYDNSDSDENDRVVPETIVKEQTISKKSKYASYATSAVNNNFRENLPNFQEDLFTYVNLTLLTYKVDNIADSFIKPESNSAFNRKLEEAEKNSNDKKSNNNNNVNNNIDNNVKQDPIANETQMILISEIFDCFAHIYTLEECRKALILNEWNPEKTALFLADNEKEIKQPLLIAEKSTLLFQTKIDSISTKNNRVEFKAVKNPIFDATQFDLLKWAITKEYVLGYKIKEGACVIFDTSPNAEKEFPYAYTEKIKIASLVAGANQQKNTLLVKANKAKFNVNWKEGVSELSSNNNANSILSNNSNSFVFNENNNLNKFYLNDEISIEKRILETIRLESLMEAKALGLSSAEQINIINNNNNLNNSNINMASPGLNPNGRMINNYLNEALNMEEIANLSNLGFEKSPSKFINAYLAKNEIKKVIKPQIVRGTSSSAFSTSNISNNNADVINNNNNLSINFSSKIGNNPINSNAFQAVMANNSNFENFNSNLSNTVNAVNSSSYNNFVNFKDENAGLMQNDVAANREKKENKKVQNNINANEFLDSKKKKGKKKIKDNINSHKEEILSKVFIKRVSENVNHNININNNPLNNANNIKTETIQEFILHDIVKGTFIKVIPCLQFLKMDTIFCYDNKNKVYYLLGNNSISLNFMVSNTFAADAEMMEDYLKEKFDEEVNLENKDENRLVSQLEDFVSKEEIDNENYFEELNNFVKKLSLVVNSNKQEMPWKFTNWNYFYLNIYELMNMVI